MNGIVLQFLLPQPTGARVEPEACPPDLGEAAGLTVAFADLVAGPAPEVAASPAVPLPQPALPGQVLPVPLVVAGKAKQLPTAPVGAEAPESAEDEVPTDDTEIDEPVSEAAIMPDPPSVPVMMVPTTGVPVDASPSPPKTQPDPSDLAKRPQGAGVVQKPVEKVLPVAALSVAALAQHPAPPSPVKPTPAAVRDEDVPTPASPTPVPDAPVANDALTEKPSERSVMSEHAVPPPKQPDGPPLSPPGKPIQPPLSPAIPLPLPAAAPAQQAVAGKTLPAPAAVAIANHPVPPDKTKPKDASRADPTAQPTLITAGTTAPSEIRTTPSNIPPTGPIDPRHAPEIIRQIDAAVTRTDNGTVEVRLNPHELGQVTIRIEATAQDARMVFAAERPETLALLRSHQADLQTALLGNGYSSLDLSFSDQGTKQSPAPPPGQPIASPIPEPEPEPVRWPVIRARPLSGNYDRRI